MTRNDYNVARERMVREQVINRGITDSRVIDAMLATPRHRFLDAGIGPRAYGDHAFPIGYSQTMSQAYMVAYLAEKLGLEGRERVLEVGTGSGYQAAVIAHLAAKVFTVERVASLADRAHAALQDLGLGSVEARIGDGALGWPEKAPFDRILLTAAATEIPKTLLAQLCEGGFLLGPVVRDGGEQEIVRLRRRGQSFELERLIDCLFVPLVREQADTAEGPRVSGDAS